MHALPLLTLTIFLPLLGVFCLLFIKERNEKAQKNIRAVALLTSLAVLGISLVDFYVFNIASSEFQLVEHHTWIKSLSCAYKLGIDGLSMQFILLTTFLTPLAILSTFYSVKHRVKEYMIAFLFLETAIIGTFCALDLILFYLFFEVVLVPMYFMIGIWGGANRIYATLKFFLYTFLGSILMLVAILFILLQTGTTDIEALIGYPFTENIQLWLWLGFFASFAVKIPMWPLHTWLPDAHVEAPTGGSVLLAAVLLKMGGYGLLRFSLPLFPQASHFFAPFIQCLSIIAVIYTSLIALTQKDMKKLVAYSSIAHMGFVTFGIFTFSIQGIQGALFQMISHGLISAGLFLSIGVLYDRMHTRDISAYGGVVSVMPQYSFFFMIFILGSIGLPGTSGFIGELLVLVSSFQIKSLMTLGLGLGIVLSAAYALWLYKRVILGKTEKPEILRLLDLSITEKITLIPLILLILFFGICPQYIFNIAQTTVEKSIDLTSMQKIRYENL